MSGDISPPPTKRRKTTQTTTQIALSPPATLSPPSVDILRIFSWNINGIELFLQKSITSFFQSTSQSVQPAFSSTSLRDFLHRHNWPAVLFLQEVKIAPKDIKTQDAVRAAINASSSTVSDSGPAYEAHFTLPSDPHNARGPNGNRKVYGVCSIVRRDLRDEHEMSIRTVDWDNEGRVSVVELESTHHKLAVFNIYAVNGTDYAYRDPMTGAVRGTRHDRKLKFHKLLMEECLRLEEHGWDILLAGDMNIAPESSDGFPALRSFPRQHVLNRADFHARILGGLEGREPGLGGVDVWRRMHGDERRYTYFPRGRDWGTSCDRIDYFVAGRRLWDKRVIVGCEILDSELERGPSDHVPIWLDIKMTERDSEGAE
jgi:exonuclease III